MLCRSEAMDRRSGRIACNTRSCHCHRKWIDTLVTWAKGGSRAPFDGLGTWLRVKQQDGGLIFMENWANDASTGPGPQVHSVADVL